MLQPLHINDRKALANQLDLSINRFDYLLDSANHAFNFIKTMGPFYGEEQVDPTFRITAEPIRLPLGSRQLLENIGNDILHMGRALSKLPEEYQKLLGKTVDFRIPPTFRIDCIIDANSQIKINEIEGSDGASALMMIEQLAYGLQTLEETTVGRFVSLLHKMYSKDYLLPLTIAIIRSDMKNNPYTANAKRFAELIYEVSRGTIVCDLYDIDEIKSTNILPDWHQYTAVLNETFFSPQDLYAMGIKKKQLLTAANYNALVNKGTLALLFHPKLRTFWKKELGLQQYKRLTATILPSHFITTEKELDKARKNGEVVKISWAEGNTVMVNRGYGVALPVGNVKQNTQERWELLQEALQKGYTLIGQEFAEPALLPAFLRKKGTSLEEVRWFNRTCVKYVCRENPNGRNIPEVNLTATEVTLGPDIVPAGRKCAFTAGILS